jgi:hypothetical protein
LRLSDFFFHGNNKIEHFGLKNIVFSSLRI